MAGARPGGMMHSCPGEPGTGPRRTGDDERDLRKERTMTTLKTTARYARYLLSSLSTLAFGVALSN
jgi:hypothetical protein